MIYANIEWQGEEQLACIDRVGNRAFLTKDFFRKADNVGMIGYEGEKPSDNWKKFMSNFLSEEFQTFIQLYESSWTEDSAMFFGAHPELAIPLEAVRLLAPIPEPRRNIVCLGKNYIDHVKEIKGLTGGGQNAPAAPVYFTKATHTVIGTGEAILSHPEITQKVDYEVELAIIIGKEGINIPKEKAEDYIFGYTIANDISARDLQVDHLQWFKGKSLITHCPMGPWIVHKSLIPFPVELDIRCYVNGELRQEANTRDMIFDIPTIISDLSRGYPLFPGDIILTGTPAGVGMGFELPKFLKPGDQVKCVIEGIGEIINRIE